jgi:hypothetical protein
VLGRFGRKNRLDGRPFSRGQWAIYTGGDFQLFAWLDRQGQSTDGRDQFFGWVLWWLAKCLG